MMSPTGSCIEIYDGGKHSCNQAHLVGFQLAQELCMLSWLKSKLICVGCDECRDLCFRSVVWFTIDSKMFVLWICGKLVQGVTPCRDMNHM